MGKRVPDAFMTEVASAIASGVGAAAVDEGRSALSALYRLIRGRLSREPDAEAALETARQEPADARRIEELALALHRIAQTDTEFLVKMRSLWTEAAISQSVGDHGLINSGAGAVGSSQIYGRDIDIQGGLHIHATPGPELDIPLQLPHAPTHFTGRATELAFLDTRLAQSQADSAAITASATTTAAGSIALVTGMAGVGKTGLAVHWAHRVQHHFPHGQLYIDLHGYDPRPPMTAQQVLDRFLRALGLPGEKIPPDGDAQADLFRTLLGQRRMLVVLDNASSAEQVRPLLPGNSRCFTVVTSRSRLPGLVVRDGAHRVTLRPFSGADAVSLLRSIIGAERADGEADATRDLAQLCALLPLVLRVAAELVATRDETTLADLTSDLADRRRRLAELAMPDDDAATGVRAVFSWSYRSIRPEAARAFRLLGLHSGPDISLGAATALLDRDPTQTRRILESLADGHLVAVGAHRYSLHDLLAEYANELAESEEDPEQCRAARLRLHAWYLDHAYSASALLYGGQPEDQQQPALFRDRDEAALWCTEELINLLAAARQAAATGDDETAWRLAIALRAYFQLRKPFADWFEVNSVALAAAERLGDRLAEAAVCASYGSAYNYCYRLTQSAAYAERALAIHRQLGPVPKSRDSGISTAMILVNLGDVRASLGDLEAARATLDEAQAAARTLNEPAALGHALENLASVELDQGRFEEARDCLNQAITIFQQIGRQYGEAVALTKLVEAELALGNVETAIAFGKQAIALQSSIGDQFGQGWNAARLSLAFRQLSDDASAREYLQRAEEFFDEEHSPPGSEAHRLMAAARSGLVDNHVFRHP